ncbi:DNA polymerase alpha/epsilon subunit B [Thraustotheca clavata]|uniref:DNA polymerase alpha/epsilon subunit B n=1 Tax=Thraustotheca clavata TaxID=74557 RepID=A0A1V9ZD46_9STRA|nr:DNA polymerase alpha/epsilon subunit B [Thraustotheca clavata]
MERKRAITSRQHDRFVTKKKSFEQQFASLYVARLRAMETMVRQAIAADSSVSVAILPKIIDLRADLPCIITGTVFKVLKNKPNLLDEFTADEGMSIEERKECFASDSDQLFLEDESDRVALTGNIEVDAFVTGAVLGLEGQMTTDGEAFEVSRIFLPISPPQKEKLPARKDDAYVALVSGLNFGSTSAKCHPLSSGLLMDYLAGRIGTDEEKTFVSTIVHTIIAGNSISKATKEVLLEPVKKSQSNGNEVRPLEQLDLVVSSLVSTMPVDILPGSSDPCNLMLPQQPLAACLLPRSMSYTTCHLVTNPHLATIDKISIAGTSGQPVDSVLQCSQGQSPLDALEKMLEWRHLAPTAPDILSCYPFPNKDVFVIETRPHIFFAGNQPEFATKLVEGPDNERTRIICIPSFSETGSIVLVNLRDLSCFPLTIDI